jgi:hypothetical protein
MVVDPNVSSMPNSLNSWLIKKFGREILRNLLEKAGDGKWKGSIWERNRGKSEDRELYDAWEETLEQFYMEKSSKFIRGS